MQGNHTTSISCFWLTREVHVVFRPITCFRNSGNWHRKFSYVRKFSRDSENPLRQACNIEEQSVKQEFVGKFSFRGLLNRFLFYS